MGKAGLSSGLSVLCGGREGKGIEGERKGRKGREKTVGKGSRREMKSATWRRERRRAKEEAAERTEERWEREKEGKRRSKGGKMKEWDKTRLEWGKKLYRGIQIGKGNKRKRGEEKE